MKWEVEIADLRAIKCSLSANTTYWGKFLSIPLSLKSVEGFVECIFFSLKTHQSPIPLMIQCDIIPKGYLWCQNLIASASIISGLKGEPTFILCSLNNEPICLVALISHAPAACEVGEVGIDMPFVQLQDDVLIDHCNHVSAVLSPKKEIQEHLWSPCILMRIATIMKPCPL